MKGLFWPILGCLAVAWLAGLWSGRHLYEPSPPLVRQQVQPPKAGSCWQEPGGDWMVCPVMEGP